MLEVPARGRVVVAPGGWGHSRVLRRRGQGVMARPASPADMAIGVSSLFSDPAQLTALGQRNAAVVAERYGYERGLEKIEQIIGSIARRRISAVANCAVLALEPGELRAPTASVH
jgi:glycosyltransferase involved in cell wall biosynthesis